MRYMFRGRTGLLLVAVVFLLAGCAVKSAEEFRKAVRVTPFTTVETLEVARSFKDVTETLRKKSKECLDVTVRLVCTNCIGKNERFNVFKPTFITTPNRTELHFQYTQGGVIEIGAPPDGFYAIVLDATPIAKGGTKIEIYRASPDEKFIHTAMRGWVTGDNMGCPDLTTR
jgi:hypothetical protein